MYRQIVINVADHETRVALLEDGTIAELFIERGDDADLAGNIYKGRIQRVLPGMQAAFIDIGLDQAAFIYVDDVLCQNLSHLFDPDNAEAPAFVKPDLPIEQMLTEGQEILVQIAKSPIGSKGSRVSCFVALPGRFLVLMPSSDHIGISRRIEEEAERVRLKGMVEELRTENLGYIVRTAAEGISRDKLAYEMHFLKKLWEKILGRYQKSAAPALLHRELNVSLRAVRDLLLHEAEKLVIDDRPAYDSVQSFLDGFMPGLKNSVEYYEGAEPIFDAYNLEGDISRALKKKVWLKSGGYIVIEHTEALVAIDVNTGRYVGKHNLEETILKTNLEAVKEIAYQIRLRDIGGILIIDFIDMEKRANREKVYNALKEALSKDRSKTHVLPMSDMGLIQMTRKRIKKSLNRILCEPCFYCDGEGYVLSRQTICYRIYREALEAGHDMSGGRLTLRVNPEIAELLHGEENHLITALEQKIGCQIIVYPNADFHIEAFEIFESLKI